MKPLHNLVFFKCCDWLSNLMLGCILLVTGMLAGLSAQAQKVSVKTVPQQGIVAKDSTDLKMEGFASLEQEVIAIYIDKSKMQAELKTLGEEPGDEKTIRSFQIAIGKSRGDKQKEGDNKTPEGIYFTNSLIDIEDQNLPESKYGPYALTLNFPNPIDRLHRKTGYGIWLHGAGNDERIQEKTTTEGCVAFYNDEIVKLKEWLRPLHSVIVISDNSGFVNKKEDVRLLRKTFDSWLQSWRNRNLQEYTNHYHQDFKMRQMNKKAFSSYKGRVFNSYKKMVVDVEQIRVITHAKYAVTFFNQDFYGDNRFTSRGRKVLYWLKDKNGDWKIAREDFSKSKFKAFEFTPSHVASIQKVDASKSFEAKEVPL